MLLHRGSLYRGRDTAKSMQKTPSDKERYVFTLNIVWKCVLNSFKYQVEG